MRFDITNLYPSTPINVTGFSVTWAQRGPTTFKLTNVYGGGGGSTLSVDSLLMWSDSAGGATTSPTVGGDLSGARATWKDNFTIPPGQTQPVYVQFSGGSPLHTLYEDSSFQITAADFYGTFFKFEAPLCSIIETEIAATLAPTATPSPTPTNTATNTATFTPTNTATPVAVTLSATATCDTVGNVTYTVSASPALPSGATISYAVYYGTLSVGNLITYGTFNSPIPPAKIITANVGTHYGTAIKLYIYDASLPAGYELTQNIPFYLTSVSCVQPTNTPT
jgi:hypothetical protein